MQFLKYISIVLLFSFGLSYALEPQGPKFARIQKQEIQKFKPKNISDINPNLDYLKIGTNKDSPAIVSIDSILKFFPKWKDRDYKNLILYHKNIKKPYFVVDFDGKINNNDTIIFLGSRPIGDTTWFDHYASEEPFFLTYDENDTREELKLINDDGSFNIKLTELQINCHIEKDIIYSPGPDGYDTHTSDNEGWFWQEILPYNDQPNHNTFTYPLILKPIENSEISIDLIFKSTTDTLFKGFGSNKYPEYRISIFFNGDSLDGREFTRIHNDTFKIRINSDKVINGLNLLQVKSYEAHPYRIGVVGIDFINTSYKSEPYKYFYSNYFETYFQKNNSFVDIDNFSNSQIIAIDALNRYIQFPKSIKTTPDMFINIRGDKPLFSLYLNDSSIFNQFAGIHLVKINKQGSFSHEHHYYFDEVAFNKMIKEGNSEDVFIFAYNEPSRKLPNEFIQSLQSYKLDLKKINNLTLGNMAFVVFQKNKLLYEELIQSTNYSNKLKFEGVFKSQFMAKVLIPTKDSSKIYISSNSDFSQASFTKVSKPYIFDKNNGGNVIVIYHNHFESFKNKYIAFRQKTDPKLKFRAIDVEDIFNEFNFGKKSPYSIKNFLFYAKNNWKDSITTLVLIGNASWDVSKRMPHTVAYDFIPSYGFPPADYWYSLLDEDLYPDINVGRISIHSIEDGENYYQKLVDYYSIPDQPWMKNFLFLSGGENDDERIKFARIKSYFFDDYIKYGNFCGTSDSVAKYDKNIGGTAEAGEIRDKINRGALWVNFLGHANQSIFDMDGWQVQKLNNYQKYSFFSTISCNTGAHADPGIINSRNEDYVYFKDKGFIGSIGSSTFGWVDENRFIILRIIQNLTNPDSKLEYIGDLLNFGKNGLANDGAQLQTKFHNAMIGDPLLKLRVDKQPNLYVFAPTVTIKNRSGNSDLSITDTTSIIQGEIYNNGLKMNDNVTIRIFDFYENQVDSVDFILNSICYNSAFFAEFDISNQPGEHKIKILIDPDNKFEFFKNENKLFEKSFYVYSPMLLPVDPQDNWDVDKIKPTFRVINKLHNDKLKYYFSIKDTAGLVYNSTDDEFDFRENYIDWKPQINLDEGFYVFKAYYVDEEGLKSNELVINFFADEKNDNSVVNSKLNTKNKIDQATTYRIEFDEHKGTIELKDNSTKVKLLSVSGDWDRNIIEWGLMEVGSKVYLDARYYRGFNILVFPDSSSDVEPIYRRFDTWVDGDNWTGDSTAAKMNLFLRDSVPDNSYIFITTSSRSFKTPVLNQMYRPENVGSMDTLRSILRNYGSRLIDSIQGEYSYPAVAWYAWKHSFAMIGKKGWQPGQAIESMRDDGDSALVDAYINFYSKNGFIKISKIGPLSKFKEIKVNSNSNNDSLDNYRINLILENSKEQLLTKQLTSNSEAINLENIITDELYADLLVEIERNHVYSQPKINNIELSYEPPVELAISKKNTLIDNPISTRDVNNNLFINLENISLRKSSGTFDLKIINNHITDLTNIQIDNLGPNQNKHVNYTLISENLNNYNNIDILLNTKKNPIEQYYFNNSHNLNYELINDKTKPQIVITFDNKQVSDADFVALKPLIKVQVFDNILTPIKDSNHIEIFINGLYITKENTDYYYLNLNPNKDNLKSELYFIPKNLEYGTSKISPANYLKFVAKDQLGNSDTTIVRVNVQQNNSLSEIITYPNPMIDDQVIFKFNYFGRNIKENLVISIYNINGQLVNTYISFVEIGLNERKIELRDLQGSKLPKGVYFYRFDVQSALWTEPRNGIFVKMN